METTQAKDEVNNYEMYSEVYLFYHWTDLKSLSEVPWSKLSYHTAKS